MITYNQASLKTNKKDQGFKEILESVNSHFSDQRINVFSKNGIEEVLSETTYFREYVDRITESVSEEDREQLETLFENARTALMTESTADTQPIAYLTMPALRKMWARTALKDVIPTEAVQRPKFTVHSKHYFLVDMDGTKHELPEGLDSHLNILKPKLSNAPIALPAEKFDLLAPIGKSVDAGDTIDRVFYIESVVAEVAGVDTTIDLKIDETDTSIKNNIMNNLSISSTAKGVRVNSTGELFFTVEIEAGVTDQLFVNVDFAKGTITAGSLKGLIKSIVVNGFTTMEMNNESQTITMEVRNRDILIPTGEHLNASLPIEQLQDLMAMYNIDGTLEIVDTLSRITAQRLDLEIDYFLQHAITEKNIPYKYTFNLIPSAGFAGTPKEWREELKVTIDHCCTRMTAESNVPGKFVIIGNPLDTMIIPNVTWSFNGGAGDLRDGIDVNYSLGASSGTRSYTILGSDLVKPGKLKILLVPSIEDVKTVCYYPYSYIVEKGNSYRNPKAPNMGPSVMMTKRHAIELFTPLLAEITIKNNDGRELYTTGY